MPRNCTYSALTLRVKSSGESDREAWFLTAEEGLIRARVFGGPKSRLRAQVAPFHQGKLWVYHDPVRDSRKVSDFDVHSYRPGIRELWERAACAGALAETVLSSHGGGGAWGAAADLAGAVLDALDRAEGAACSRLGVYFLWHWAGILGIQPELPLGPVEGGSPLRPGPGAIAWLRAIGTLPAEDILMVSLDGPSLEQAKLFSQGVLAEALGKRLPTWEGI